jgi:hypothetical protein
MKRWLRTKLRSWLGINSLDAKTERLFALNKDLVSIGVDVHFKTPHMILIYSNINGGQLRHIDANFDNMKDLSTFVHGLKKRFNTDVETWDVAPHLRGWRRY